MRKARGRASTHVKCGLSAKSFLKVSFTMRPATSALPFACGRCACEYALRMPSLAQIVVQYCAINCDPWSEVIMDGMPNSPHEESSMSVAASLPVSPACFVGLATIHPLRRSTHNKNASYFLPRYSTLSIVKTSS